MFSGQNPTSLHSQSHPRAVIFANGLIADSQTVRTSIQTGDILIAANGGTYHLLSLDLIPSVIVGDLDSIDPDNQANLIHHGTQLIRYPREKDQTDLELAISYAIQQGVVEILFFGLLGGRMDQTLANLLLLSREEWRSARLIAVDGPDTAYLLRSGDSQHIQGSQGDTISLIPLTPNVRGVSTKGLYWALNDATLLFGTTLAISNEMTGSLAEVHIDAGKLMLVHRNRS
jgi:thiamine pyrophosphokinase